MGTKRYKADTPGRRHAVVSDFVEITRSRPEKSLLEPLKNTGGRNNRGRMTARHRGGGHKRRYRKLDFKRRKDDVPATVQEIEYDPNRSARIALLEYEDGEKRYILAPAGIRQGQTVRNGTDVEPQTGNCLPLRKVPLGLMVHNVELKPGKGGQMVRSAGSGAQVSAREGKYVQLIMPSGEIRRVPGECRATIGRCSNIEHETKEKGKAGRSRWLGRRPHVRGKAQNPVDHPLGGGEAQSNGGRHPVSRTGVPAKGGKTRKQKKYSRKLIIRPRKR